MRGDAWTTDLLIWEARIVLEALTREEERLQTVIAVSENEDEIADRDEDLIKLRMLLRRLRDEAVAKFGPSVLNFEKGPL
jgi:hypothetical protein